MAMQIRAPIDREAFDFDLQVKTLSAQAQRAIAAGTSNGSDVLDYLFRIRDTIVAGDALDTRNPNAYYQTQHGGAYNWQTEWATLRPILVACAQAIHNRVPRNAQGFLTYQKLDPVNGLDLTLVEPTGSLGAPLVAALQNVVDAITIG